MKEMTPAPLPDACRTTVVGTRRVPSLTRKASAPEGGSARLTDSRLRFILLGLLALVLAGCGDSGRQSLQGTVTLDGQPLEAGYIRFRPEPGSPSPTAGGAISAGRFAIGRQGGIMAGRFRVEITASRPVGRTFVDMETGEKVQDVEQYLPARYNTQTELEVEVTSGGSNTFQFDLESQ